MAELSTLSYILDKISMHHIDHIFCDEEKPESVPIGFMGFQPSKIDPEYVMVRMNGHPKDRDETYLIPVAKKDIEEIEDWLVSSGYIWINGR